MADFVITAAERASLVSSLKLGLAEALGMEPDPDLPNDPETLDSIVAGVPAPVIVDPAAFEASLRSALSARLPSTPEALRAQAHEIATAALTPLDIQAPEWDPSHQIKPLAELIAELTTAIEDFLGGKLLPLQLAEAIAEPVAEAVEEWLNRLIDGLKVRGVPERFSLQPPLFGSSVVVTGTEDKEVVHE